MQGMLFLVLTAAVSSLRPAACPPGSSTKTASECAHPSTNQMLFLYSAFALIAIASGGIRPSAYPFGADQFKQDTVEGKKSFQSYSNWYFFGMVNLSQIPFEQQYSSNCPRYSPPLFARTTFSLRPDSLSTLAWSSLKTDNT